MVHAYVGGIAPRSEQYMRTHWDHAKGFIDDAALDDARKQEAARWLDAQRAAGLDAPAPSLVAWEDILRPLTACPGIEEGALTRTFETNTFHRRPVFTSIPEAAPASTWRAAFPAVDGWILTLPSPYDAFVRGEDHTGGEAGPAIADILRQVALDALDQGALRIRWQEPSALYPRHDPDIGRFDELLARATRGIEDRSILHFTHGDITQRPAILRAVPTQGISLPITEGLPDLSGKELSVQVVRGDQTLIEDPAAASQQAVRFAEVSGATLWGLTHDVDLEHVPFAVGVSKLASLAAARPVEVTA